MMVADVMGMATSSARPLEIGNVIAGRGDKTEGSINGAIVGAVVGNQVFKSNLGYCRTASGYYDRNNRWVGGTAT